MRDLSAVYHVEETSQEKVNEQLARRKNSIRPINERIRKLRDESVHSIVRVSPERAKLITDFYSDEEIKGKSIPLQRAFAFKYLLEHCSIPIESGQLIVGIRGTGPNEVPTYPEICLHSPRDLELLDSRENMPFAVDEKTSALYEEVITPYWSGKTMRDMLFASLPLGVEGRV